MTRTRVEIGVIGVAPTPDQLRTLDVPETVVLNFAKVCNLWCQHCLFPSMARQREQHPEQQPTLFLPEDTLRAVVDEVRDWPRPPVLRIAADGEPLIHPAAVEMIRYAKARDLTVSLTTNGILLTDKLTAALLDCGIDVIDVSIDAATDSTFAKVRPSRGGRSFYGIVERNVRALISARDERPHSRTRILVNMIDQPLAHHEVQPFITQWKAWGADAVLIRPFHSTSGQTQCEGVATAVASAERFPCKFPFTRVNVGFDEEGHPVVYYCSHDWSEKTVVGVLGKDGTLRDIWLGAPMSEIRRRHLTNDFPAGSFCGSCPDWYLGWGKSHHALVADLASGAGE